MISGKIVVLGVAGLSQIGLYQVEIVTDVRAGQCLSEKRQAIPQCGSDRLPSDGGGHPVGREPLRSSYGYQVVVQSTGNVSTAAAVPSVLTWPPGSSY